MARRAAPPRLGPFERALLAAFAGLTILSWFLEARIAALEPRVHPYQGALLVLVFASLGILGAGYLWRDPRAHLLRVAGWVLFALYWPTQAPHYLNSEQLVNSYFSLVGPLALFYVAGHEWRSYKWDEEPPALRWAAGTAFVSATTYFVIYRIPAVTDALIHWTAEQTAWMLGWLFHVPATVGEGQHILINGSEYSVTIILACTAIQSIMIFVGAIWCLESSPRAARWRGYAYTVPVIYLLNLFRNAGIVYGYKVMDFPGWWKSAWAVVGVAVGEVDTRARFDFMHGVLGQLGSLLALIVIAIAVFRTLPELHGNILDLFELPRRRDPGHFDRRPPLPPPDEHPAAASGAGK